MGCRCRLHRRHDRPPIRPGLTGDGHEVVHPEDGSDATGREHVLGELVADRSISAGHVERPRKGCVQGEFGGVGVGCRRRRSSGHGSIVRRQRDHTQVSGRRRSSALSGGRFTLGVVVGGRPTATRRRARSCRPAIVTTSLIKREVLNADTPEACRLRSISATSSMSSIRSGLEHRPRRQQGPPLQTQRVRSSTSAPPQTRLPRRVTAASHSSDPRPAPKRRVEDAHTHRLERAISEHGAGDLAQVRPSRAAAQIR
jgi:hypothetical protein